MHQHKIYKKYPLLKMNKVFFIIIGSIIGPHHSYAQWKAGVEQYSYTNTRLAGAIVPMCHIQSANNWYGELRYNYEEVQTLSLFGGKSFAGGNDLQFTIIPMAGFSSGRFTGFSFATNAEAEWRDLYFSSQLQYSSGLKKKEENFFFTWSELGYNVTRYFFTGVSMQYTRQTGQTDFEPGFLAGFTCKKISFPFYFFKPFRPNRYFILGVNYEFSIKTKNKPDRN